MAKAKQASGGKRLREAGKKPILLGPTEALHARLTEAARLAGVPLTQLCLDSVEATAEKILKKNGKQS